MSYSPRTAYLYKAYDRKEPIAILGGNMSRHKQIKEAKEQSKKHDCLITGRDGLGNLLFIIDPFGDRMTAETFL
jgi:hypothetical protein